MEVKFQSGGEKIIRTIPEFIANKSSYLSAYLKYPGNDNIVDVDKLGYPSKILNILVDICNDTYEYEIYVSNQIKKINSKTEKLNCDIQYNLELIEYDQLITLAGYLDIDYVIKTLKCIFEKKINKVGIFSCCMNISGYTETDTKDILSIYPTFFITKYVLMNIKYYYNICCKLGLLDLYQEFIKEVNSKKFNSKYVTNISELEKIQYQKTDIVTKNIYNEYSYCVNSVDTIMKKFNEYTNNYFKDINYDNMIISGGFIYGIVDNLYDSLSFTSDIDIFVYGTKQVKEEKIKYLLNYFKQYKPIYFISNGTYNILIPEIAFDIQIINSKYGTPNEIVDNFDYGYTQLYYNGKSIYCTNKCLYSLITKVTCIFKSGTNDTHKNISRIEKAYAKGLEITDIHDYIKSNKIDNINFSSEYIPKSSLVRKLINSENYDIFAIIKNIYQIDYVSYNSDDLFVNLIETETYFEGALNDIHRVVDPVENANVPNDPVTAHVKFYNDRSEKITITDVIEIKKSDINWYNRNSLQMNTDIMFLVNFNKIYPSDYNRRTKSISLDKIALNKIKYGQNDEVFTLKLTIHRTKLLYNRYYPQSYRNWISGVIIE